ncbi:MAG: hypothetical protein ACM3ZT_09435 [Bacillota bacterium]
MKFALVGLGVGLFCGLFAGLTVWMVAIGTTEGALGYFLWILGGFMAAGMLIGFLFPKKAGEYFWQFVVGMFENLMI